MNTNDNRLYNLVSLSKSYCELCESAPEYSKEEFIQRSLDILPRLYWNFFDLQAGVALSEGDFFGDYVDETLYNQIQGGIASLLGESDTFLETFEEDMKYSDTPIAASISEGMADLYQPLFNFISVVHDSEGAQLHEAFISCKEDFDAYWSQTLCNILRPLNSLRTAPADDI